MLNVIDNAQSNSHIAAHKSSDSGHLLVLPALHELPLLGNDNSPSRYFLREEITKYLLRASQSGLERYSLSGEWCSPSLQTLSWRG